MHIGILIISKTMLEMKGEKQDNCKTQHNKKHTKQKASPNFITHNTCP